MVEDTPLSSGRSDVLLGRDWVTRMAVGGTLLTRVPSLPLRLFIADVFLVTVHGKRNRHSEESILLG